MMITLLNDTYNTDETRVGHGPSVNHSDHPLQPFRVLWNLTKRKVDDNES